MKHWVGTKVTLKVARRTKKGVAPAGTTGWIVRGGSSQNGTEWVVELANAKGRVYGILTKDLNWI